MDLLRDYIKEVERTFEPLEIQNRIYDESYVRSILEIESTEVHKDLKTLIREMTSSQDLQLRSPVERLIYNEEYVRGVLGVDIPLNESYPYSNKLQQQILEEHLLFEGFFSDFRKLSADGKNLALALRYMMEDGSRIDDFVSTAYETVIKDPLEKITGFIKKILSSLKELFNKFALPKIQSSWDKIKDVLSAFGEKLQGAWDSVKGMSGWKQALVVMGFGSALGYLWSEQGLGDIIEAADGVLEKLGEVAAQGLEKLSGITDKSEGDEEAKNVLSLAKESASPKLALTSLLFDDDNLDSYLNEGPSVADKAEKVDKGATAVSKASELAGKLGDKDLDMIGKVKAAIMEQLDPLINVLKEKVVNAFKNIVKQIGAEALMGLATGGVGAFISGIKKAFGGFKLVSKLFGATLGKFVSDIENPKEEREEAEKGEDDPTDDSTKKEEKNEVVLREYIRQLL